MSNGTSGASATARSGGISFDSVAADVLDELVANCERRGFAVELIKTGAQANQRLLELIPSGADVTNGGSTTLKEIGFMDHLENGPHDWRYRRADILAEPDEDVRHRMRRLATTADYMVGSVNALAVSGEAVSADAGGTRVGAYAFGAGKVIWVVGTNKIVPTLEDAIERVRTVTLPLEDARMRANTSMGSWISKLIIIESEYIAGRITLLLVDEALGF